MEDIDTEKLRDMLIMLQENGASYVRVGEVEIAFHRFAEPEVVAPQDAAPQPKHVPIVRKSGYQALFPDKLPTFGSGG